jgi:uncharacterized protein (TIGR03437 family)
MKLVIPLLLAATGLALAGGPAWDSSGSGQLNGTYNFRQVQYYSDGDGNVGQQVAYFGTISFSGTGTYALGGGNTVLTTGSPIGIFASGTYSVAASGYGFLSNPLSIGNSVYFLVSNHLLIGSSTESGGANGNFVNDLFIAAPATPTFTNASFNGAYTVAGFLPTRDVSYVLNPDGAGHLGTVNQTGYDGTGTFGGSLSGATYAFSGGVALLNLGPREVDNGVVGSYGQESLDMSPDGNFVFGGAPDGYDIFVGVRNPAAGSAALTAGLYYEVGLDVDASNLSSDGTTRIDTYYGVFNAFSGNILGHERLLYAGTAAEGVAYTTTYPAASYTGLANVGQLDPSATVQYTVGAGGIRIGFGIGPWLGIEVALPTAAPVPNGAAFIDPTGIVNTASSAPFTAGISPGEFVTLYDGVNLANGSQCWTAGPPFPTSLGGVQVMIDGVAAPIYCVGSQITFIVPYAAGASPIATIQVVNGTVSSNLVTAYVYKTSPGVFTVPAGGLGFAAAQHAGYALITPANPALPGETIVVYLSGLGNVFAVNGVAAVDGAATGAKGDTVVSNISVDVAGFGSTSIAYAGLTPTTAGLYQINFQVPTNAPAGNDALAIVGAGAWSSQALLPVGPGATGQDRPATKAAHRQLPRLSTTDRGTIP